MKLRANQAPRAANSLLPRHRTALRAIVHYLHTVERSHVAMDVIRPHVMGKQILGKFLRHALGQRRDQRALATLVTLQNLFHQVVYLVLALCLFLANKENLV